MSEKIVIFIGMTLLWLFLPYGITMLMTGTANAQEEAEQSGIMVEYEQQGQVLSMDLEEYMVGVLAAELPQDYNYEVYKAQAVITRTNARKLAKDGNQLSGAQLQMGYYSEAEMESSLGTQRCAEYRQKLKNAIRETYGEVLTYEGNYIDALYHSVSVGKTASALDVYGKDVPYLVSVASSGDVEAKDYMSNVTFAYEQLVEKLGGDAAAVQQNYGLSQDNYISQISISEKSEAGYVKKVQLGSQVKTGEEFRNMLSLPSLYFYMENLNGTLRIVSLGKGHGLGMSQFGANKMANEGKDYKDILKYYFQNAEISEIN